MSNLSNLVRNTCDGLSEGGQMLYLDLLDRYQGWRSKEGEALAFREATRFDETVGQLMDHIMRNGPLDPHWIDSPDWKLNLNRFFADRWKNNFLIEKEGSND